MMLNQIKSPLEDYSFLIVGTIRNCEATIHNEVKRLREVFGISAQVCWLLIESDSVDNTVGSLRELKLEIPFFDYVSLGELKEQYPERARRIAFCRDKYVKEIKSRPEYSNIDYVVIADLDGMCRHLTRESVESCWDRHDWVACFANQPQGYYDLWALRHEYWCPKDPFQSFNSLVEMGVDHAKAYKISLIDKLLKINPSNPWIAVKSAFGGLGIYKIEAFMNADYSIEGEYPYNVCEHTTFNKKLNKSGAKMYINPRLVNINRSNHVLQMKIKYFLLRILGFSIFEKIKFFKF
jgi:hypothetical protein